MISMRRKKKSSSLHIADKKNIHVMYGDTYFTKLTLIYRQTKVNCTNDLPGLEDTINWICRRI